jgi:glutaconate CoA-transferase, subunit A
VSGTTVTASSHDMAERRSVVLDEAAAAEGVRDGLTVAIGGFINAAHPMALVRQLIRSGTRDLTLVGAASSGLDVDMLIAAGCVRTLVTPYVGAEGLAPIGPAFRRAAQEGELDVFELDEAHFYAGLRAAAQRLPFNPWRAGVGTSYPEVNPRLKTFTDPIDGELLIAVPALEIDVAFLHAAISDCYGNVQHEGTGFGDRAIHAAADRTVVQVEQIVSNEQIRRNPAATSVPGADAVVRAPYGAHPFASHGYYPADEAHIREYVAAATDWLKSGSRGRLDEYLDRFLREPVDHVEYLERVGLRQVLALSEYA